MSEPTRTTVPDGAVPATRYPQVVTATGRLVAVAGRSAASAVRVAAPVRPEFPRVTGAFAVQGA
ncbi:hypothetical protein OG802_28900 [Streptomyces sp. NBC_00704]|uniref:hypothetical protein n=1 Tax=Streptomyces sp. NBC_00704 TaxID=2975809 RepID=UPI002E363C82|nr:hypothetical protein [Streptomyces sp. NBC_00704]